MSPLSLISLLCWRRMATFVSSIKWPGKKREIILHVGKATVFDSSHRCPQPTPKPRGVWEKESRVTYQ